MAERDEADKLSHAEVRYEPRSTHMVQRCNSCRHFIRPNRCEAVETPVASVGWCIRWEKKSGK